MWMKIGHNDITAQVPVGWSVLNYFFSPLWTLKITYGFATQDFFHCPTRENNVFVVHNFGYG
jgi:hypothetical protein